MVHHHRGVRYIGHLLRSPGTMSTRVLERQAVDETHVRDHLRRTRKTTGLRLEALEKANRIGA